MNKLSPLSLRSAATHALTEAFPQDAWGQSEIGSLLEARAMIAHAESVIAAQRERITQLENMALTDELTGLVNRRGLMTALNRELAMATRDSHAVGVLVMIDLNKFKSINDTHGHNAGDAYLRAVAQVLSAEVRPHDVVARLGGDEFAVLLTRISAEDGLARAAKLEAAFHGKHMMWNGVNLPLRASFGATAYGGHDVPEALMASADLKLYAQKTRARSA